MAGFQTVYVVGGEGGFMGSDGVNPVEFMVLVGYSDRMWYEPHYFDRSIWPIGRIQVTIPSGPSDPNGLLDACLAFCPRYFQACPSLPAVDRALAGVERLDFDAEPKLIPQEWAALRDEARPLFDTMNIWRGELRRVHG